MKHIPLFKMKDSALKGFFIQAFDPGTMQPSAILPKLDFHRDDFYIFQLIKSGQASMIVDFNDFTLTESSVFYILPGQIHRRINPGEQITGWLLLVDPAIISPGYRVVFEDNLALQQLLSLSSDQFLQCHQLLSLLVKKYQENIDQPFQVAVMHAILESFLGIVAGCFMTAKQHPGRIHSKAAQIPECFGMLLLQHITTIKKPSAYNCQTKNI